MRCPSPKCNATIEMQNQEISADGSSHKCPECNDKYWVRKEEFVLRAYKKQGSIYCFGCGNELGGEHICPGCGNLCPDYSVVQLTKFTTRKSQKAGFSFALARRPKKPKQSKPIMTDDAASTAIENDETPIEHSELVSEAQTGRRLMLYFGIAALLLVLAGGIGKLYLDQQVVKEYSRGFVVALYGVKSGTDLSLKHIKVISSGWEETLDTTNIAPTTSKKDLDKMLKVKERVDQAIGALNETPENFVESRRKLIELHSVYEELYALNISRPTSYTAFTATVNKTEDKFFKTANDLKSTMPEELVEELRVSVARYKNLKFMVK